MEDNPTPPNKEEQSLSKLVELMTENNRATSEIERDGRNTRRHLLEMKKIQQASLEMSDRVNIGFDNFFETMNANKLSDQEKANERASIFEEIRDELKAMRSSGIPQNNSGSSSSGGGSGGGRMAGVGKLLSGAGIGVGAAAAGVAAVFASSAFLLDTLENMDGKKIVANVKDLLEISRLPGEEGDALRVMGTLSAIGVGLAAFGIGSFFAKAASDDTAKEVKAAVETYLSIAQLPGKAGDSARVMGTLSALGVGLVAFGVGSFFANAASANQAQEVKDSVSTLLSISQDPNIGGGKVVSDDLGALSGGLLKFGVGAFFAKGSHEGQGEAIRETVGHLLSIAEDPNATGEGVKTAVGTLAALGTGLAAFGVGSFFAGVGDATMSGESIKNEVATLLSIGGLGDIDKIDETVLALGALGAGLAAFGGGSFVGSLANAAATALDFLSGNKSPIESAIHLGENADTVNKGVDAFERFADSVERFNGIGGVEFDAEKFATDLATSSKILETVITGGKVEIGGMFNDFKVEGLAKISDDVDAAVLNINRLKGVLNMDTPDGTSIDANQNTTGVGLMNVSAENVDLRTAAGQQAASNVSVATNNSQTRGGDTVIMNPPKPNKTREANATR